MTLARTSSAALFVCLVAAAQQAAASGTADIVVRVSSGGHMVTKASCRLVNPVVRRQVLIGNDGEGRFEGVEAGTYDLECTSPDFGRGSTSVRVEADATTIAVSLALELPRIGETHAKDPARSVADPVIVSRATPLGKMSRSLYDALASLGGAQLVIGSAGDLTGVSLEGRDPRLTEYSFDGARLSEPGALRAIPEDALQSISVDDGRRQVELYTLAPTAYPEYWARQRLGGFGNSSLQVGARGAVGSTGYVIQASQSGARNPLDGSRYRDLSGLDYQHEGWARGASILAKAVFPVGPMLTATVETLRGNTSNRPIDATLSSGLPDGIGPGNMTTARSSVNRVEIEGDSKQWHFRGDAGVYGTQDITDDSRRIVALQSLPLTAASRFHLATADASAVDSLAEGKTLNFGLSASRSLTALRTTVNGAGSPFSDESVSGTSDIRAVTTYVLKRGKGNTTTVSVQGESRGPHATGAYLNASGTYGSSSRRVFARFGYGTRPVPPGTPISFSDPGAAQYDCVENRIVVRGPSEAAAPVAELHASVGVAIDSHVGSFSAQIYRTTDANLSLSNALGFLAKYPGATPMGYQTQLLHGFADYGGCAAGGSPYIYVQHDVSGLGVEYRGVDLMSAWKLNREVTVQGALHVHQALLRGSPPELQGTGTTYVLGHQLPTVPLFDASLTVDWALGDHKTELIGNAAFTPANNANHLPGYSLITLGALRRLSSTTSLTIVGSNVTHQDVGLFASTGRAVALPTAGGVPLLLPATPLAQPQLFILVETRVSRQK